MDFGNLGAMVSSTHKALTELFGTGTQLADRVLIHSLGVDLPPYATARAAPNDLSATLAADRVVVYDDDSGTATFAVIVEPQLKFDDKKLFS